MARLNASFFARATEVVARELVGYAIVRPWDGLELVGIIGEVGAHRGGAKALEVGPGVMKIFTVQGGSRVLCIGTEASGVPAVVTIRRMLPVHGIMQILAGPEHVVAGLHLGREHIDGVSIEGDELCIEDVPSRVQLLEPQQIRACADNCMGYYCLG